MRAVVGVTFAVTALVLASACASKGLHDLSVTTTRVGDDGVGTMTAPRRPFAPRSVPDGWRVVEASLESGVVDGVGSHTLYLGPGATATSGPALAVGFTVQEDEWYPGCKKASREAYDEPSAFRPDSGLIHGPDAPIIRMRHGFASILIVGPDDMTRAEGYVLGRDISEQQLRTVAGAVDWDGWRDPRWSIDAAGVPKGFSRRATTFLSPWQRPWTADLMLESNRGHGQIAVGSATGNAAFRRFARFWAASFEPVCGPHEHGGPSQLINGAVVRVHAYGDKQARKVANDVARDLRSVPRRQWIKFAGPDATSRATTPRVVVPSTATATP